MTALPHAPVAAVLGGSGAGQAPHLARLGFVTRVAEPDLTAQELTEVVHDASVVLVALTPAVHRHLAGLRVAGTPLWVDLSDWAGESSELHDPFVEAATHLFLSDLELADPLRTAERLLPGKELVVITHGKRGATAFFPDTEPFFVLPYDAGPVVSTSGARDAFCSGTAYGFAHGWSWPDALRAGAVVAGGCVASPDPVDPALTPEWLLSRL